MTTTTIPTTTAPDGLSTISYEDKKPTLGNNFSLEKSAPFYKKTWFTIFIFTLIVAVTSAALSATGVIPAAMCFISLSQKLGLFVVTGTAEAIINAVVWGALPFVPFLMGYGIDCMCFGQKKKSEESYKPSLKTSAITTTNETIEDKPNSIIKHLAEESLSNIATLDNVIDNNVTKDCVNLRIKREVKKCLKKNSNLPTTQNTAQAFPNKTAYKDPLLSSLNEQTINNNQEPPTTTRNKSILFKKNSENDIKVIKSNVVDDKISYAQLKSLAFSYKCTENKKQIINELLTDDLMDLWYGNMSFQDAIKLNKISIPKESSIDASIKSKNALLLFTYCKKEYNHFFNNEGKNDKKNLKQIIAISAYAVACFNNDINISDTYLYKSLPENNKGYQLYVNIKPAFKIKMYWKAQKSIFKDSRQPQDGLPPIAILKLLNTP